MSKPLLNKVVLVACSPKKANSLVAGLKELGGEVLPAPVIEVKEIADKRSFDAALASLREYSWIIFTSSYGAAFFLRRLAQLNISRDLCNLPKICAIGPATAATLRESGLGVELIPDEFVSEGVLKSLAQYYGGLQHLAGRRVLLPRAREARDVLPDALSAAGAQVDVVPCYQTVPAKLEENVERRVQTHSPDLLVFTSSSTVRNLMTALGCELGTKILLEATVAVIGPVTAGTVESLGKRVDIIPRENTVASLVDAIREYYGSRIDCAESATENPKPQQKPL